MSIKDEVTSPKANMRQAIKNNSKKLGLNNTSNNKIQYLMGANNNMLLMGDNIMFKPKIKSSSVSSSNNNQYGYEDEDDEQEENENDDMNRLMRVNQDEFEVEQDEEEEDEEDDEENEDEDDEDDNNEDQDEDDDQENFLQNAANFSSQAAALQFYVKLPGKKKNHQYYKLWN